MGKKQVKKYDYEDYQQHTGKTSTRSNTRSKKKKKKRRQQQQNQQESDLIEITINTNDMDIDGEMDEQIKSPSGSSNKYAQNGYAHKKKRSQFTSNKSANSSSSATKSSTDGPLEIDTGNFDYEQQQSPIQPGKMEVKLAKAQSKTQSHRQKSASIDHLLRVIAHLNRQKINSMTNRRSK